MDKINERIPKLRKELGLNRVKFAEFLGLTSQFISTVESGKSKFTEANIRLICLTFGVHEEWLKTGEGPIFTEEAPGQEQLLKAYRGLTPDGKETAIKIVENLVEYEAKRGWAEGIAAPDNEETGEN